MLYFGMSAVRYSQGGGEIEGYRIHPIDQATGDFLQDNWDWKEHKEVTTLINRGSQVLIVRFDTAGKCERGSLVGTQGDKNETLVTTLKDRDWDTLSQLPKF